MPDPGRAVADLHLDDIEAEGAGPGKVQAEIGADGPPESPFLAAADGKVAGNPVSRPARLHLDEDGRVRVEGDQVDLLAPVARIAPVARENGEAPAAPQVLPGKRLAGPSDLALQTAILVRIVLHPSIMATSQPAATLAYKLAVLVFIENREGEHLLMLRAKPPNFGVWSPIGGKLETSLGESPFECAVRETFEETGHVITAADLHLFATIAEKAYEGQSHWLMFLFRCRRPIAALPKDIAEGRFGFFSRAAVSALPIPETDRMALWPTYDAHRDRFVSLKADCAPGKPVRVEIEEITPP